MIVYDLMQNLERYITELRNNRPVSVAETGTYSALERLLDEAGALLTPKVNAVVHPKSTGAGIPDLALFDEKQPSDLAKPSRGVIEVKGTSADLYATAQSEQVKKYLAHYGQVLVTNLYRFLLVTRGEGGKPWYEEYFELAPDEKTFWAAAQHPRTLAAEKAVAFTEYLQRVMLRKAPLITPKDVAAMLASYARVARNRLDAPGADLSGLETIRKALEAALGVRFEDAAALQFFKSTLIQTLFYGVFSAWVLWHERRPAAGDRFHLWRHTRELRVPVMQEIFDQLASASNLHPLNIEDVLEWTADALNRVDRAAFFEAFETGDAVQYFYEPFLEAFDPELRKQLGVWYTPREVVRYMVARVDAALRDELGIADGLADESVVVLDPCCGTGAFLVEVLHLINRRLTDRDGSAMAALDVAKAMRERIFGFELLPAPFVVAHLQLGLLLTGLGAPLKDGERAGVFLTNSLTGWEPAKEPKTRFMFPMMEKERDAANTVKQQQKILVVIGNPPYSGYAGIAVQEERTLTDAYRTAKRAPKPQGQGLNDLYVRFFRMAERKITSGTGRGIVSYISNYSWLDGLSHTGMRERFLDAFDSITVDSLNGDKYRTGKTTPEGLPDPSVFSTEFNREGIQVGTAIVTMIRRGETSGVPYIRFRNLWGVGKRAQLAAEAEETAAATYQDVTPALELGYPFAPATISADYLSWPKLPDLFPTSFPGVQTSRDDDLVDIDRPQLEARIKHYFDPAIPNAEIAREMPSLMKKTGRFDPVQVRTTLLNRGLLSENIVMFAYRPFDVRWLYWEPETKLLDEKRPEYFPHVKDNNIWLTAVAHSRREWSQPGFVRVLGCKHLDERGANLFPLYLYPTQKQRGLWDEETSQVGPRPNLSQQAEAFLSQHAAPPEVLFYHTLAVLHAPAYRLENAGALRQDWPRVPLPSDAAALSASAELGRRVASLLDPRLPVNGVTHGDPLPELRGLAALSVTSGAVDFDVRVNWGYSGQGGAVMPGSGHVTTNDDGTLNIWLNPTTYWASIPRDVWDYTLGGYQVLKKWLSYRESKVLGRPLRQEEAREFTHIARRIAALIDLSDELDASYARCKASAAPSA